MLELQERSRRLLTLLDLVEGTPEGVLPSAFGPSVGADAPLDYQPPPPQIARGFGPSVGADVLTDGNPD
jgi:hypothetical protein